MLLIVLDSSLNEPRKQAMTGSWSRREFRMELASHKPGMVGHFDHLYQHAIFGLAYDLEPSLTEALKIIVIEFVSVSMALDDFFFTVAGIGSGVLGQDTLLATQAHRAPEVGVFVAHFGVSAGGCPLTD